VTAGEAEELAALITAWAAGGVALELVCGQDVFGELQEFDLPEDPEIDILVPVHYEHGQWKLVRHDACDVIGGETIDQAVIVTHRRCTILGQSD
jgi:hypothetical protein